MIILNEVFNTIPKITTSFIFKSFIIPPNRTNTHRHKTCTLNISMKHQPINSFIIKITYIIFIIHKTINKLTTPFNMLKEFTYSRLGSINKLNNARMNNIIKVNTFILSISLKKRTFSYIEDSMPVNV